jgi:serine phosphatase RsbU (regulator of sigma subunit)
MTAWLESPDGQRHPLDTPCLVGRGPYNHIVLDDTRISRQHAKISPESGGWVVYDLNSANGTFVNEAQVKRQKLTAGDVVRFGPFPFEFFVGAPEARTRPLRLGRKKFDEIRTLVGDEPVPAIVDTLDAMTASSKPAMTGLHALEDAERRLSAIYAFLKSVSSTLDVDELLDRTLASLLDVFAHATMVTAWLRDTDGAMQPYKSIRRNEGDVPPSSLPPGFYVEVVDKGRAVLSAPAKPGGGAAGGLAMHAPMMEGGVTWGILHVRGGDRAFHQADLDLLTGLAAQAALALSNARMHSEQLQQQRLRQDLQVAEQIQRSFLPRALPQVSGIELTTEYRPAFSVGGDFYDAFWLRHDRIGLFIGDVSGKGVSAALLMARISSDLRLAAAADVEPGRVLELVNRIVLERRQTDIFVTGVYLTLDVPTRRVLLANAGHLPPLLRRRDSGSIGRVEGGGTAIGIFEDTEYEQAELVLEPGDTLLLCTDGVVEATDTDGVQFGFERLEASAAAGSSRAAEVAARLLTDVRAHVGRAPQSDDLTLLVCGATDVGIPARIEDPTDLIRLRPPGAS